MERIAGHMALAKELGAAVVVVTVGCGGWWGHADTVEAVRQVLHRADDLGVRVALSMSRRGSLSTPWACQELLKEVPEARVCCEFAGWCKGAGRVFGSGEANDEDSLWWPSALELIASRSVMLDVAFDHSLALGHPADPVAEDDLQALSLWWSRALETIGSSTASDSHTVAPMVRVTAATRPYTALPGSKVSIVKEKEVVGWLIEYAKALFLAVFPKSTLPPATCSVAKLPRVKRALPSTTQSSSGTAAAAANDDDDNDDENDDDDGTDEEEEEEESWFEGLEELVDESQPGDIRVHAIGDRRVIV